MSDNKSYRIKANLQNEDHVDINLNLNQDVDVFEFLSLKMGSENFYRLHTANYGCVAGRVLANNAVGVPNVKISIFIEADEATKADSVLSYLYPYSSTLDKNDDGVRYNLLPEEKLFDCHQNVGTFPLKRTVLDDSNVFEVFDKYYKFTTTTNSAGDYMIFGVPVGSQTLHMDVDLSDIGDLLSQKPRDFIYKGYNVNQFENSNIFKKDKNLNTLTQLFSQNESVNVHPFWGEVDEMGEVDSTGVRITRKDININYKFEPTCVFMGSLITDEKSNGFTKRCNPTERMGKMDRLTTGEGTIEMIRKTPDGTVEEFSIMGNQLIDGNGTWCYQIPMNLDYVRTDEYGNIVPTNDIEHGLPTRARVRFRFSLNDFASDYQNNHLTKILVPNNPESPEEMGDTYVFGTNTPPNEFRDLMWNKVYSVKGYIPRIQHRIFWDREKRFSGVKAVNVNVGNNPIPYNNMRIDITFLFILQCAIMHMLVWIAGVVNTVITALYRMGDELGSCYRGAIKDAIDRFKGCVTVGDGACPDLEGWYFAPKCSSEEFGKFNSPLKDTLGWIEEKEGIEGYRSGSPVSVSGGPRGGGSSMSYQSRLGNNSSSSSEESRNLSDQESTEIKNKDNLETSICLTNKIDYFMQCIEIAIAQEYEVIQFDFYNDWMNGMLYIPRWFASIRKKRTFLFGLIKVKEKVNACMEGNVNLTRKYVQQCALTYSKSNGKYSKIASPKGCDQRKQKCHKRKGREGVSIMGNTTNPGGGFIHSQQTLRGDSVYYFRPCDWYNGRKKLNYFATDIILLGSLSKYDIDGIPQTFKELTSSSYQMPTNLAATNMGTIAYMYGKSSDGNSICSNGQVGATIQNGVTKLDNTFSNYKSWSGDKDDDGVEYEVTEAAGIDWGYTGPGQKMMVGNKEANFDNGFYQPGGHFLGIACFNSESNVKSCVNLSRVCEVGAMLSQRQPIVKRNGNRLIDDENFLIPTGFISKDEISDSGFRSEFATLNHNSLIAEPNKYTGRYEYKFISMLPKNFDGSFESLISAGTPYNNTNGSPEPYGSNYPVATAFTRTIEDTSVDYYDFRLGVNNDDFFRNGRKVEDKYMIEGGGKVSLPMYNNSYYFYFGLKDGSTALDRLYKEFYSECPSLHEGEAVVKVTVQNIEACGEDNSGSARVFVGGIDTEAFIFEYILKKGDTVIDSGTYPAGASYIDFGGLSEGSYSVTLSSPEFEDIRRTFTVSRSAPPFISQIIVDVKDFEKTKYNEDLTDTDGRGSVTVTWPDSSELEGGLSISDVTISNASGTHFSSVTNGVEFFLWTDEEYTLTVEYECGSDSRTFNMYTFTPDMPQEFDLSIGNSNVVTYNRSIKGKYPNETWWEGLLTNGNRTEKFYAERAVAFRNSVFNYETGSIVVRPIYGNTPYVYEVDGAGEKLGGDMVYGKQLFLSNGEKEGYDLSYENFMVPTMNVPSDIDVAYTMTDENGNPKAKYNYVARYSDNDGDVDAKVIPGENEYITLPSIYKPFFFRCAIFKDMLTPNDGSVFSLSIVNGNLFEDENGDKKFSEIKVCSQTLTPNVYDQGQWWKNTGGSIYDFKVDPYRGSLLRKDVVNYNISIKETEPDMDSTVLNSKIYSDTVRFLGDGGVPDASVRYFLLYRSTINGNRQPTANVNNDYVEELRQKLVSAMTFDDTAHLVEGQDTNNIYWKGSCTNAFTIALSDGGYLIFNPKNELSQARVFAGDVNVVKEEFRASDCFVLGVCDPWTKLNDEQFSAAQNANSDPDIRYKLVPKDADMLAIFRLYTASDFVKLIENPNLYPDISDSENDFQDSFVVNTNRVFEMIATDFDAAGNIITEVIEAERELASFQIKSEQQIISVPAFNIKAVPPTNYPLWVRAQIYIVNTSNGDPDTNKHVLNVLDVGQGSISDRIDNTYIAYSMFLTLAEDLYARDMGTGQYKVMVKYKITIERFPSEDVTGVFEILNNQLQVIYRA